MNKIEEVEPGKAFELLTKDNNSYLVDVRTISEWSFVGLPDLSRIGKDVLCMSWLQYPNMDINPNFLEQLENHVDDKSAKLFFLCKVGGRSYEAANFASKAGYENCYNIIGGFEGKANKFSHRGKIDGWKACGLPWVQN